MPKIPLSVVILAQKYSAKLQAALESVVFADEVIVINTSGLKSFRIPKETSATIRQLPPVTDFASTRNQALNLTKNNWVCFLDSDEVCQCPDPSQLLILLQLNQVAYRVNRTDHFLGQSLHYGETANAKPIRLIRKHQCQYSGLVHETPICDGEVGEINPHLLKINHFPHASVSSFFTKITWYSKLDADQRSTPALRLLMELATYPLGKWLYNLFFLRGILDGYRGLIYATLMSYHSFFVRLFQLERMINKKLP